MIKLITCDLDGTLFDSQKNISKLNIQTIKSLKECLFVVASGRPIEGVMRVNEALDLIKPNKYTICYNGAMIIENSTKKPILFNHILGFDVKQIYNLAVKNNLNFHAFKDNGELITNEKNPYTAVEERINKIDAKVVDITSIDDNQKFIKCMIVGDENALNAFQSTVGTDVTNNLTMVRSSSIFLEFLNKKSNKGEALKFLANYLNIDMKDTMAIGDADNDKQMIIDAGVGVAMENSFKEILPYADYITTSNENDGVANAIIHFNIK